AAARRIDDLQAVRPEVDADDGAADLGQAQCDAARAGDVLRQDRRLTVVGGRNAVAAGGRTYDEGDRADVSGAHLVADLQQVQAHRRSGDDRYALARRAGQRDPPL